MKSCTLLMALKASDFEVPKKCSRIMKASSVVENYHRRGPGRVSQRHLLCFSSQFMCPLAMPSVRLTPAKQVYRHTHAILPKSLHRAKYNYRLFSKQTIGCTHKSATQCNSLETKLGAKPFCPLM